MKSPLIIIALLLASWSAFSANQPIARIADYGLYEGEDVEVKDLDKEVPYLLTKKFTHKKTTDQIPCTAPISWGFRLEYLNLPKDRPTRLTVKYHHPTFGTPSGVHAWTHVLVNDQKAGDSPPTEVIWTFRSDFAYEMVPGKWTFEAYLDDELIATKTFTVIAP